MVVHRSVSKTVRVLNGSSFFHRDLFFGDSVDLELDLDIFLICFSCSVQLSLAV